MRAATGAALSLAAAVMVLAGCAAPADKPSAQAPAASAQASPEAGSGAGSAFPSAMLTSPDPAPAQAQPDSAPARVSLADLGINAEVQAVAVEGDTLQVPERGDVVGWMDSSANPGATGPMVLVGHVDTDKAPAVFYDLQDAEIGSTVVVTGADAIAHPYVISEIADYVKAQVPLDRLYGATTSPELRLVTCSGAFDEATGHYQDNTVVYAAAA